MISPVAFLMRQSLFRVVGDAGLAARSGVTFPSWTTNIVQRERRVVIESDLALRFGSLILIGRSMTPPGRQFIVRQK